MFNEDDPVVEEVFEVLTSVASLSCQPVDCGNPVDAIEDLQPGSVDRERSFFPLKGLTNYALCKS